MTISDPSKVMMELVGGAWNPTKFPLCLLDSEVVSVLFTTFESGLLADAVWTAAVGQGRWTLQWFLEDTRLSIEAVGPVM